MAIQSTIQSGKVNPAFYPLSIVRALWKGKYSIILIWLLGTAATVAVVYSLQPVYRAEALILVESQKIPENFVTPTVQTALEARLDLLKQQVLSNERLWRLIQDFNLYPQQRLTRPREEVLDRMHHDITIGLERGWSAARPGAFRVAYEALSPTTAAEIANRVGKFFITENLKEREQEASGTSQFLDSSLQDASRKLQEQEVKLRDFKQTYNGELPEQQSSLLANIGQSRAELLGIRDSLARAQQNKLILENSLAAARDSLRTMEELVRRRSTQSNHSAVVLSDPRFPQPEPAPVVSELDQARIKLSQLRLRYSEKHREVQNQIAEVARLEQIEKERTAHIAPHVATAPAPARTAAPETPASTQSDDELSLDRERLKNLNAQVAVQMKEITDLEKRHDRILQDIAEAQKHLLNVPIREQQLAAITRDYDTSKANYHQLLDKKLAADVATNMERWQKAEGFVMLNEAPVPERPVRPRRTILAGAGTVFSLMLAAAIVFLRELRKNVLLGQWELPAGTLVVGHVTKIRIPPGKVLKPRAAA